VTRVRSRCWSLDAPWIHAGFPYFWSWFLLATGGSSSIDCFTFVLSQSQLSLPCLCFIYWIDKLNYCRGDLLCSEPIVIYLFTRVGWLIKGVCCAGLACIIRLLLSVELLLLVSSNTQRNLGKYLLLLVVSWKIGTYCEHRHHHVLISWYQFAELLTVHWNFCWWFEMSLFTMENIRTNKYCLDRKAKLVPTLYAKSSWSEYYEWEDVILDFYYSGEFLSNQLVNLAKRTFSNRLWQWWKEF
jgi:hypothetical protein